MIALTNTEIQVTGSNAQSLISKLTNQLVCLLKNAAAAYEVSLERRQLLKMTDGQLADIGVTRQQVIAESNRSFFDIPAR
ncbi:MAG: DUF1127 domain-containing protein [Pseudomonadota bacterium]